MISEAGDRGALYQPNDTPDSVNILTIHASKGLEFKYVFVVNMVEDRFPSRRRGDGIEIPSDLIKEKLPEGDSHFQEERRLFYVAATRAKERLYFTSADDYGGTRSKKISRFLNELGYVAEGEKKTTKLIPKRAEAPKESKGEFVYDLPKAFSFSQVKSYETCPYRYKLAHILKIPTKGSASFSFGQTIHSTLQKFYGRIQELNAATQTSLFGEPKSNHTTSNIKVPALEELLKIYEDSWIVDWYNNQSQREEYYQNGKDILTTFYKAEDGNWTIPVGLESWFKIKVGEYFIHGRIDRIDGGPDKSLEIIDYKTGKGKEKITAEDKEQLLIYQIAVEELPEYKHLGTPKKLTYHYVNDNLRTSFIGAPEDLEKLKSKLHNTITKIHVGDFVATPSQFACDYCEFKTICEYRV
jgi:DNA helicase-2/ATP-dependent DNA helicase PcrA